jgi:hypothetical protein
VLGRKGFLEAMVNSRYREQYEDAVSCFLRAQEIAGLDILTDGDAHYDEEVGSMSWQGYPPCAGRHRNRVMPKFYSASKRNALVNAIFIGMFVVLAGILIYDYFSGALSK